LKGVVFKVAVCWNI